MQAVHDLARAEGLERVELDVRSHNEDARLFYESLGYRPVAYRMSRTV
jgi:ribosomal protein S18 acetylase RimI-like enzyme